MFIFSNCFSANYFNIEKTKMDKRENNKLVQKTLKIVSLNDKQSDYEFWITQSIEKRLETLEMLRQQYINWKYDTQQGFQRVYRIIELSQS